jgi:hypothetical protein
MAGAGTAALEPQAESATGQRLSLASLPRCRSAPV